MQIINANVFEAPVLYPAPNYIDGIAITTNGIIDRNGNAVMGAGIAKTAKEMFPGIEKKLATYLQQYGNRVFYLGYNEYRDNVDNRVLRRYRVFSFPTKHDWKDDSDVSLICTSAQQLIMATNKFPCGNVFLPPPGCGNGNLNFEYTVRPWLDQILVDDKFKICLDRKGN